MVQFTIINMGTLSMNKFWDETERVREPSATCTLLQAGGKRLLVDPSPKPLPLAQLLFDRTGLHAEDIDIVFCTHWHGDHRFGLPLFAGKSWLMAEAGLQEWRERIPQDAHLIDRFSPAEGQLPEGISLLPTPGHTMGHHSLIVDTQWGKLIVTGDAAMTPEFFAAEAGFHNSIDFDRAAETIRQIKATAKLVIPGHGNLILNW
ncbi:MAG: MBL fold metallo-hydrolase [Anaerolineae bacterium]|nr:MBL fold metallo-hydrolase [Anaerolineae bacterium]